MKTYTIVLVILINVVFIGRAQNDSNCQSFLEELYEEYGASIERAQEENLEVFNDLLKRIDLSGDCGSVKSSVCRLLANFHMDLGAYHTSDSLCDMALKVDIDLKDTIGIAKTYNVKTALEHYKGNSLEGIKCNDKAIGLLNQLVEEKQNIETFLNQININRALCLRDLGRKYEAKQLYLQMSSEGTGVSLEALQGLGDIAVDQSLFDSAIVYYQQLYPFYKDDLNSIAHLDHSMGIAYLGLKDTITAKKYFLLSKGKAKKIDNKHIHFLSLIDLFGIANNLNTIDSISTYKEEMLELEETSKEEIGDQEDQIGMLIALANDLINNNKNIEALRLIKEYTSNDRLPFFYNEIKDKVKTERYFRIATIFIAGLIGVIIFLLYAREKEKELTEERFRQEQIEQEKEIELAEERFRTEKAKKEKEVSEMKSKNALLLKEKEKQELKEKFTIMEFEHAEELLNTEYELKTKNSILAHDLKADTFGIRNSLNSLVDFFDQKPIETNKSDLEILYQNSILLSDDVERLSAGLEPDPKIWLTRLKKMLKRLKEDPGIIIKIEVSDIIDTSISPFIGHRIYTILRVLVDNVLNHSKADLLKINTFYEPDILTIMVEDNGNGGFKFPEDAGVGLTSVIRRVKELGGTSVVDTNNKTKFTLKIPVKKLSENE